MAGGWWLVAGTFTRCKVWPMANGRWQGLSWWRKHGGWPAGLLTAGRWQDLSCWHREAFAWSGWPMAGTCTRRKT